jgi:hypothetical protein
LAFESCQQLPRFSQPFYLVIQERQNAVLSHKGEILSEAPVLNAAIRLRTSFCILRILTWLN